MQDYPPRERSASLTQMLADDSSPSLSFARRSVEIPDASLSRAQVLQVVVVMASYGIVYSIFSGNLTVSSLAASTITQRESQSTLPLVALFIGALLTVGPASLIMKRYGRRTGFVIGGVAGVLSSFVSYLALRSQSFSLLVVGGLLLGVFDGFSDYLRFAAAEIVSEAFQGRAVSIALCGGALCSVLGPSLASIATSSSNDDFSDDDSSNDDDDKNDNMQGSDGYQFYYLIATGVCFFFCIVVAFVSPNITIQDDTRNEMEEKDERRRQVGDKNCLEAGQEGNSELRDHVAVQGRGTSSAISVSTDLDSSLIENEIAVTSPLTILAENQNDCRDDRHSSRICEAQKGSTHARAEIFDSPRYPLTSSSSGDDPHVTAASSQIPSLRSILMSPEFLVSILTGMNAQFSMVMIMTALPLAMVNDEGYSFSRYALTIQCHLLGMFCPGFFTGALLDSAGIVVVLMIGIVLQAAAVAVGSAGSSPDHFLVALVLLGIAWNFLSVGSTKLLLRAGASNFSTEKHNSEAADTGDREVEYQGLTMAVGGEKAPSLGLGTSEESRRDGNNYERLLNNDTAMQDSGRVQEKRTNEKVRQETEEQRISEKRKSVEQGASKHMHALQAIFEFAAFAANALGSWLAGYKSHNGGWNAVLQCAIPLTVLSVIAVVSFRFIRPSSVRQS